MTEQSPGDLLGAYPGDHLSRVDRLVIFANLPYIRADEQDLLSSDTQHEPTIALFGTEYDGLGLYRRLMHQVQSLHRDYPHLEIHLLFEYGHAQRSDLMESLPDLSYEHFDDYR